MACSQDMKIIDHSQYNQDLDMLEFQMPNHFFDGSIREEFPGSYSLDDIPHCEGRAKRASPRYKIGVTLPKGVMMLYSATKDHAKSPNSK